MNKTISKIFYLVLTLSTLLACTTNQKNQVTNTILWQKEIGKYNNYRIPSLIVTKNGTVLAFCEAREAGDTGDIDLLVKRSEDNGNTWSEEEVVWSDGTNTCGNPCPVVDEETGRIWLLTTWNNGEDDETEIIHKKGIAKRLPFALYSDDDGLTWSTPMDISETCRDTSWGWYATGPGIGIQVKNGKYKGRLVIPANHSYNDPEGEVRNGPFSYGCHVLFSDDNGESWKMSNPITPAVNESQVVELSDGTLMMNMRSYNKKYCRASSISKDGGETWSELKHEYQLVEPICQASILNYGKYNNKSMHLFSNPAAAVTRRSITVRGSFDDCQTWNNSKLIYPGFAAYSCLTKLPNGNIALFFEGGEKHGYDNMFFVSFPPDVIFSDYEFEVFSE